MIPNNLKSLEFRNMYILTKGCFLSQGSKNFVVALKNPSLGAKIGNRSAVVCHINKGKLFFFSFCITDKKPRG